MKIPREARRGAVALLGLGDEVGCRMDLWLMERPVGIRSQSGLREGVEKIAKLYYHFTKAGCSGHMAFRIADSKATL